MSSVAFILKQPHIFYIFICSFIFVKHVKKILLGMKFTLSVNAVLINNLVRENFFPKFNAYFDINEMDACDQFCKFFKT